MPGFPFSRLVFVLESVVGLQAQYVSRLQLLCDAHIGQTPSSSSVLGVYSDLRQAMAVYGRYEMLLRPARLMLPALEAEGDFAEFWQSLLEEAIIQWRQDEDMIGWNVALPRSPVGWLEAPLLRAKAMVPMLEKLSRLLMESSKQQYAVYVIEEVRGIEEGYAGRTR